jgi:hypothetical protein
MSTFLPSKWQTACEDGQFGLTFGSSGFGRLEATYLKATINTMRDGRFPKIRGQGLLLS